MPAYNGIRAKMLCRVARNWRRVCRRKGKKAGMFFGKRKFFLQRFFLQHFFLPDAVEQTNRTKISDLDYTIAAEADIPEELQNDIEEKKAADFKMTYKDNEFLYIVRGYGEQETGGYSICIRDLYLTSNAIIFDTELIGPRKGETISKSPSYPYIVVKVELRDENVVFE